MRLRENKVIATLLSLRGNARACVLTEPLWGIPHQLYMPFVSLYMMWLGLSKEQVGLLTTISMLVEFVSAMLSGVVTDKLGRRTTTIIFDLISWSIPTLLWAFAQNMTWFVMAAMFNGLMRFTVTSWGLLLVEDTKEEQMLHIWTLVSLAGAITVVFQPLSRVLVSNFDGITVMRGFYLLAFVMMTAKFIILFRGSHETEVGLRRLEASRGKNIFVMLWEMRHVFFQVLKTRRMLLAMALMVVYMTSNRIAGAFWSILVNQRLMISEGDIVIFTMIKSCCTILGGFFIMPRLSTKAFKHPTMVAFGLVVLGQLLLVFNPGGALLWPFLVASIVIDAFALSVLGPMVDSLMYINADQEQRANIVGMVHSVVLAVGALFPWICGMLAEISLVYPFVISMLLLAAGMGITVAISHTKGSKANRAQAAANP